MRSTVDKKSAQAGYTLVEIAIVMLLIGIFAGAGLHLWGIYQLNQRSEATELSRIRISTYLNDFKALYGRYPCPARYDAERDDSDYGVEGNCADVTVPPGSCSNGYCVELSQRTVTMSDGTIITPRVRRGTIPFRTLFMPEEMAYDAYNARFSYAVTEILTNWRTFSVARGGISVIDGEEPAPHSVVDPPHSALYFVFSHGKDNVGAYNMNGQLILQCGGTMLDNENCNTDSVNRFAIYRSSLQSEFKLDTVDAGVVVPGGGGVAVDANPHYDDQVDFRGLVAQPIFKISDTDPDNIHDVLTADKILTVGLLRGENAKLNVTGNLRTVDTQSVELCQGGVSNQCFEPYLIGGTGMHCPNGEFARAIGDNRFTCDDDLPPVDCVNKGGRFIIGIDSNGEAICGDIGRSCAATSRTLCGVSRPLPTTQSGRSVTLTGGSSYTEVWTCNDGTWSRTSSSGVCNCTPSSRTTTSGCGTGYNGTQTTTTTTVCPSGQTTTTTNRSQCTCTGYTETGTRNCPAPQTGTQTRTRPWTCVNNTPTAGTWSGWAPPCACPAQAPQTESVSCPPNQDGTATRTRTLNTSNCTWGAWSYDYSRCSCNTRTETRTPQCAAPETGTYTEQRTLQCPSATWGNWTVTSRNCTCNNQYITRPGPNCPPGQVGSITERRYVDCRGNNIPGYNWEQASNTCALPPTYAWKTFGTSTGSTNGNPRPRADDSCTNPGAVGSCYVTVAAGISDRYNCRCE